jgi:hypothetical protein
MLSKPTVLARLQVAMTTGRRNTVAMNACFNVDGALNEDTRAPLSGQAAVRWNV